ncbi:MAG: hypothetical protein IK104_03410, partial [Clostridia bacterium]|nr:hypothetical protein [Clostridia bacterium]
MLKKTVTVILALLMLCSVFPIAAFAEDIVVSDIDIRVKEYPVPGERPDATKWAFDYPDALQMIGLPDWYRLIGGKYVKLGDDEVCQEGVTYYFRCVVNVKSGYTFYPINISINASLLDFAGNYIGCDSVLIENHTFGKQVTLGYKCVPLKQIDDIDVTGVVPPVPGETPYSDGELGEGLYFTRFPAWYKLDGGTYKALLWDEPFIAGKTYYYQFHADVKPGYKFNPMNISINAGLYDSAGNYIKSDGILVENSDYGKRVTVSVKCEELKQVDDIEFKNVVLPVPGEKPDRSGDFVEPDALYFVTPAYWCKVEGGKYLALADDETFEEGKTYYFRCKVNVKPGYKFNPMNISLDGALYDSAGNYIPADSVKIENDPQGKLFTMGVKCAALKQVDDIEIKNVVMPVPGEKPDRSGDFVDPDALYFVTPAYWCKLVDGHYVALADDETFEEGKTYYFRCKVNVKPGYKFNPMNISLDGALYDGDGNYIPADSVKIENDPQGKLFTMGVKCAELKQVDDIEFKNVVAPVAGKTPDNAGEFVDPDALYFVTPACWCKLVDGHYVALAAGEKFEAGKTYYFRCKVNVKPGYKFNPMNISLNGGLYDGKGNYIHAESVLIENDPQGKLFTMGVKCAAAYLLGDVDADGKITAGDARLALRAAVQLEAFWNQPDSAKFLAADVTKDKKV